MSARLRWAPCSHAAASIDRQHAPPHHCRSHGRNPPAPWHRHGLCPARPAPRSIVRRLLSRRPDRLRVIHPRHEQTAAYMALGAALATGKPQAFAVVPGPGMLNAGAALLTAYGMNAPVIGLIGQIPQADIDKGHGHLHEIHDQLGLLRHITKWAERIRSPQEAPALVSQAVWHATTGRPRPGGAGMRARHLGQARRGGAARRAPAAARRSDRRRGDCRGGQDPGRGRAADHRRRRRRHRCQRRGDRSSPRCWRRRSAPTAAAAASSRARIGWPSTCRSAIACGRTPTPCWRSARASSSRTAAGASTRTSRSCASTSIPTSPTACASRT